MKSLQGLTTPQFSRCLESQVASIGPVLYYVLLPLMCSFFETTETLPLEEILIPLNNQQISDPSVTLGRQKNMWLFKRTGISPPSEIYLIYKGMYLINLAILCRNVHANFCTNALIRNCVISQIVEMQEGVFWIFQDRLVSIMIVVFCFDITTVHTAFALFSYWRHLVITLHNLCVN